jgi:hypothetical protein
LLTRTEKSDDAVYYDSVINNKALLRFNISYFLVVGVGVGRFFLLTLLSRHFLLVLDFIRFTSKLPYMHASRPAACVPR